MNGRGGQEAVVKRIFLEVIIDAPEIEVVIPVHGIAIVILARRTVVVANGAWDFLNDLRVHDAVDAIMPIQGGHLIAIDHIDGAVFAGLYQQMRISARLVRKQYNSSRSHVLVLAAEIALIVGGEIIHHIQTAAAEGKLEDAAAVISEYRESLTIHGSVESAICCSHINVACGVRRRPVAAHPDGGLVATGTGIEHSLLRQRAGVIGKKPAVIGWPVIV